MTAGNGKAGKELWAELARQLRIDSIRCTTAAGSGHPTSGMSAADLMSVLVASHLHYDWSKPHHPGNDSLIFSKGHACPLLYAIYRAVGVVSDQELLSLRTLGSRLEGHPTPDIPWVEAATGSLGQGLAVGVGDALAGKYLDKLPYRVWVLLGDSELAEGSVWEAFAIAAHYKLNNLVAVLDINRLGQRGETMLGWDTASYTARAKAFGWLALEIDGHNLDEIEQAYQQAEGSDRPVAIIARTEKGHGASLTANRDAWHGKGLKADEAEAAIAELGGRPDIQVKVQAPPDAGSSLPAAEKVELPVYQVGDKYATRQAYGDALKAVGLADPAVVGLDAEVSNSTFADIFAKACPERFFEMFIAEQLMVSVATGLQHRRRKPFCSTFAAFFTRAFDQIRMAAISQADIRLCGSHAGVSIGEDGPSQMALEDLAMMRAVYGSTVLYPSDATSTAALVAAMAERDGVSFLRTTREKTPVLYSAEEKFPIGGSKTLRSSGQDVATIIAAGITLHEALKAADLLQAERVAVRVIDLYSVKPLDATTLEQAVRETDHLIVVEDHWRQGGLGEAVLAALAERGVAPKRFSHLAVAGMPHSGKPAELLNAARISAEHIAEAVRGGRP